MATGAAGKPRPGSTWDEVDAEGRQFLLHGSKHIAIDAFNKAAETPGCGWPALAHRADCRLRLLDFRGALNDAVLALDMHAKDQRTQSPQPTAPLATAADALWREAELEDALVLASRLSGRRRRAGSALLIGDDRGQRVEGLKADVRHALGGPVSRVLRRDLVRDMMLHKGVSPKRLTAGQRLSWVTESSIQADPPPARAWDDGEVQDLAPPLPLPIIWGALPWTGQASDTEDEEDEDVGVEEQGESRRSTSEDRGGERGEGGGAGGEAEAVEVVEAGADTEKTADGGADSAAAGGQEGERRRRVAVKTPSGAPAPRWGWLRQIPGHDHICADPLVAAQAERIAELRVLGILERDRSYLRRLVGEMQSVQERPGERREDCGCPPCPGPNLTKWQETVLRAEKMDEKQDPLARSKWEAQDVCRKTVDELNHLVGAQLRCRPRYLHPAAGRGPSPRMRAARSAARRERTLSTVRFMMRRVHGSLGTKQYRDVEQVGARLTAFLERLPCRVFPDRLEALARTLDCRAAAARGRSNSKLAIELQKRRCALAADHGLPAPSALSALYARALDELALLLFSVADYPLAETFWTERLARLQQQAGPGGREERAQVVFQLARCCFVQGHLRMAGPKRSKLAEQGARKDHRSDLPEFPMSLGRVSSADLGKTSVRRVQSSAEAEEAQTAADEESGQEMYECEWRGACRWTPELLGYDLGSLDGESEIPETSVVELKPTSVQACLRIIMEELGTQDPLNEYGHLVAVERYPESGDAARTYPLMPPDFDLDNNIMNKEYEAFERRFRDACHYFVSDITGVSASSEAASVAAEPPRVPDEHGGRGQAPGAATYPEAERLPSVTEEPEVLPPPPGPED